MFKYLIMISIFVLPEFLLGQENILDNYINHGLEKNLALKQKKFSLEESKQALKEARGMFLPSVGIEARYSRAGGGRMIDIPVGDLVNPIYKTLNDMLASIGQPPVFPTNIPNEQYPFLREKEHETKVRVIQPIFQPAIYYNYRLKSNLKQVDEDGVEIFKQQLIADIKTAYFNYLKAMQVVDIYEKSHDLLEENLRVSEKLFQNQKVTEDVVFRAKAEIADLEQQQANAEKDMKLAAAYFNFLLNRPFDSSIEKISEQQFVLWQPIDLQEAQERALKHRVEFRQLENAIQAACHGIRITTTTFLPNLVGVVDYGFQGEEYKFTEKHDYWMASAVLNWNLFNGGQDRAKYQQAVAEKNKLEAKLEELKLQIKLQVQEACDNLLVAEKSIQSATERLESSRKSFKIINKKFEQGMIPHIEYIDARTTLTNAEIASIIAKYDYHVKFAELERVVGKN